MPHFKSSIPITNGYLNFYFNRIETAFGNRYHLSTRLRNGKAIIFHMEEDSSRWRVVRSGDTPDWLIDAEDRLSQKIIEHERESLSTCMMFLSILRGSHLSPKQKKPILNMILLRCSDRPSINRLCTKIT
jgi:hypothetical protein